jgi:hypothetical protein
VHGAAEPDGAVFEAVDFRELELAAREAAQASPAAAGA